MVDANRRARDTRPGQGARAQADEISAVLRAEDATIVSQRGLTVVYADGMAEPPPAGGPSVQPSTVSRRMSVVTGFYRTNSTVRAPVIQP